MPTPDASQFIRFKKNQAIQSNNQPLIYNKSITHLYQPVPTTSALTDFLPSFTNKKTSPLKYVPINVDTAPKTKVAGVKYCG